MLSRYLLSCASLLIPFLPSISAAKHVCGTPVLTGPTDGLSTFDNYITISGYSTDPACLKFFVYLDDRGTIGYQALSGIGPNNQYSGTSPLQPGEHTVWVASSGNDPDVPGTDLPRVMSAPIKFTIKPIVPCPVPVIITPAAGSTVSGRTVSVTGTFAGTTACPDMTMYVDGSYIGYITTSGTTFTATATVYSEGAHSIQFISKSSEIQSEDSSTTVNFNVVTPPCPQPVLTLPVDQSVTTSRFIAVSGTKPDRADCYMVDVYIDGTYLEPARVSGLTFSDTTLLNTYGPHKISVVARSSLGSKFNSVPKSTDYNLVTVSAPQCPSPIITTPSGTTQSPRQLNIQGTSVGTTACPKVEMFVNGVFSSQSVTSPFLFLPTVPADGQYIITIYTRSSQSTAQDSLPATIILNVATQVCPQPVITSPVDGSTDLSSTVLIQGTAADRADCIIDVYLDGTVIQQAGRSGTRMLASVPNVADGDHIFWVAARSNVDPKYSSKPGPNDFISVAVNTAPPCPAPVLISPINNSAQNGQSISISGTAGGGAACPNIQLTVDGVSTSLPVINGAFTYTAPVTTEGAHSVSVVSVNQATSQLNSPAVSATVRVYSQPCPAPVLTSPKAGQVSSKQIFVSGTVDNRPECGKIEVYLDGKLIYSSSTAAAVTTRRKRSVSDFQFNVPTTGLSSGSHNLFVLVTGDNNGVQTPSLPILLQNVDSPMPTGGLGRRRNSCLATQTMCPFKAFGRVSFECVDDIDNNIERCGACDGPDCTAEIDNVSDVACIMGQCVVSSCLEGFTLSDNTCVAESARFVEQEW